jgi:hypothetical protein
MGISVLCILALTKFTPQVTPAAQDQKLHAIIDPLAVKRSLSDPNESRRLAEKTAYTGHGMLFDKDMKKIKLNSPLLRSIQTAMLNDIQQALNG